MMYFHLRRVLFHANMEMYKLTAEEEVVLFS